MTRFKAHRAISLSVPPLVQDAAGGAALVVILFGGLMLPSLF